MYFGLIDLARTGIHDKLYCNQSGNNHQVKVVLEVTSHAVKSSDNTGLNANNDHLKTNDYCDIQALDV